MNDKVIIFVSDDNYINHVKSIMANCMDQGKYTGDFAVICPVNSIASIEFKGYGIHVLEVESTGFLQKFSVFDKFFNQWKTALYMDCDILVQDDLEVLFEVSNDNHHIWMDTEDTSTLQSFWRDKRAAEHPEVYEMMNREYPWINNQTFNSAFILFHPLDYDDDIPQKLMDIQNKIEPANRQSEGGTDQQVINLLLWNETKPIPNKRVCFWGCAEPENDVYSEKRGWAGGERIVAIHYTRWYAPWVVKAANMGAYDVDKLGIPCHDLYQQNLNKFDELFKKAA